jgi:hypothetical protein
MNELPPAPMRTATILMVTIALVVLGFVLLTHMGEWILVPAAIGAAILLGCFGVKVPRGWVKGLCWVAAVCLALAVGWFFYVGTHITF